MASTSTDPLERAVLSGALFAGPDPEGREPDRSRDDDDDDYTLDDDDGDDVDGAPSDTDIGFVPPSEAAAASSSGAGQLARATTSRRGQSHNTGVKGVLADYRASKQQQQHKQPSRTTASQSITSRLPKDVHNGVEGISLSDAAADDDDLDSSEGEREAKERYRRQRMAEMMKMGSGERRDVIIASKATGGLSHSTKRVNGEERGTATAAAGRIRHGGLGRFGHLREVGQHQFVHATEEAEGVTVVVHVYDPSIPACATLNAHLVSLARAYPRTKFLRALSEELEFATGDEEEVLPTLLIYRNSQVFKTLVAFDKDVRSEYANGLEDEEVLAGGNKMKDSRLTRDMVEDVLIRHGILDPSASVDIHSDSEYDSE